MPYFSRLTDIVTCNLTDLLEQSEDPQLTLQEIIHEMEEGLAGAQRSVQTSQKNEARLQQELQESQQHQTHWEQQAMLMLQQGDENEARKALYRKKEAGDLSAGLEQQVRVARSTCQHLMTTYRALEARLAEAQRKLAECSGIQLKTSSVSHLVETAQRMRGAEVEDELAELKRRLQ